MYMYMYFSLMCIHTHVGVWRTSACPSACVLGSAASCSVSTWTSTPRRLSTQWATPGCGTRSPSPPPVSVTTHPGRTRECMVRLSFSMYIIHAHCTCPCMMKHIYMYIIYIHTDSIWRYSVHICISFNYIHVASPHSCFTLLQLRVHVP